MTAALARLDLDCLHREGQSQSPRPYITFPQYLNDSLPVLQFMALVENKLRSGRVSVLLSVLLLTTANARLARLPRLAPNTMPLTSDHRKLTSTRETVTFELSLRSREHDVTVAVEVVMVGTVVTEPLAATSRQHTTQKHPQPCRPRLDQRSTTWRCHHDFRVGCAQCTHGVERPTKT